MRTSKEFLVVNTMKSSFVPDYKNIVDVANNKTPKRIPLYEHIICESVMEKIQGINFKELICGDYKDKKEYFKHYTGFFRTMGYDTVSFEQCITKILPGAGALYRHTAPVIKSRDDFEKYPWSELADIFFKTFKDDFKALSEIMPQGMKAIGGPGNGLFEIVQDLYGYEGLCYISVDDPGLYAEIFKKAANVMKEIWLKFLQDFSGDYCVCRFGDDLGYKTQTLLSENDIRLHLMPHYKEIVAIIHSFKKPFLIHSCGCIFSIMDELIDVVGIDGKHSNEDDIAPFSEWLDRYGERIGNFGGVDTDVLCKCSAAEIEEYVTNVYVYSKKHRGVAIGSGNSIPEYVPPEGYLAMVNTVRKLRE